MSSSYFDQCHDVIEIGRFASVIEIVHPLEVEPELGGGFEGLCDSQGAVGGD